MEGVEEGVEATRRAPTWVLRLETSTRSWWEAVACLVATIRRALAGRMVSCPASAGTQSRLRVPRLRMAEIRRPARARAREVPRASGPTPTALAGPAETPRRVVLAATQAMVTPPVAAPRRAPATARMETVLRVVEA